MPIKRLAGLMAILLGMCGAFSSAAAQESQKSIADYLSAEGIAGLLAPEKAAENLVINEVYLDTDDPRKSWIEIYNPTSSTRTLGGFTIAGVRSNNLLSWEVQEQNGVEMPPASFVVIYTDQEEFRREWDEIQGTQYHSVIALFTPFLKKEATGPVITIWEDNTVSAFGSGGDDIRIGASSHGSATVSTGQLETEHDVVMFSRTGNGTDTDDNLADFKISAQPTPGQPNQVVD